MGDLSHQIYGAKFWIIIQFFVQGTVCINWKKKKKPHMEPVLKNNDGKKQKIGVKEKLGSCTIAASDRSACLHHIGPRACGVCKPIVPGYRASVTSWILQFTFSRFSQVHIKTSPKRRSIWVSCMPTTFARDQIWACGCIVKSYQPQHRGEAKNFGLGYIYSIFSFDLHY